MLSRARNGSRMQSSARTRSNDLVVPVRGLRAAQEVNVVVGCLGAALAVERRTDSAVGRPSNSQQTAPASGRQMIAVAQGQRGIRGRRTAGLSNLDDTVVISK